MYSMSNRPRANLTAGVVDCHVMITGASCYHNISLGLEPLMHQQFVGKAFMQVYYNLMQKSKKKKWTIEEHIKIRAYVICRLGTFSWLSPNCQTQYTGFFLTILLSVFSEKHCHFSCYMHEQSLTVQCCYT